MQHNVEKRIHFELIATRTSRDQLGKLSGQCGQGHVKSTEKKQTIFHQSDLITTAVKFSLDLNRKQGNGNTRSPP